jgi:hypothetical protein
VAYNGVFLQTAAGSSVGRLMSGWSEHHAIGHINIVRSEQGAEQLPSRFPNVPVVSTDHDGWQDEVRQHAGPLCFFVFAHLSTLLGPLGLDANDPRSPPNAKPTSWTFSCTV